MNSLPYLMCGVPLLLTSLAIADGPRDNHPDAVRQVPPPGIDISPDEAQRLQTRLQTLQEEIETLRRQSNSPQIQTLLPDVEIFARAVDQSLRYQEMYSPNDLKIADRLLNEGLRRAEQLAEGSPAWLHQKGLVVRGFRSRLDGTVQPYGLDIGEDYSFEGQAPVRCDIWFHGRGERSLELQFIGQRMSRRGPYSLRNGIVLHPYGRYSNAFKFAGEVDTLEALDHIRDHYRIDDERISVRGFSMGGAACWQFAVHYADRWFAANPGAGFSETPEFLKSFQGETLNPPWYEERLWRLYDCPVWSENLRHVPTIAYSGEIDKQKQAADVMVAACNQHGIDLVHMIGPDTPHRIHPESNRIIAHRMQQLAEVGRKAVPESVRLTTVTLKYNRMHWVTVNALEEHWEIAHVAADIIRAEEGQPTLKLTTENITDFSLNFPPGRSPFDVQVPVTVMIDGQEFAGLKTRSDWSFQHRFHKHGDSWIPGAPEKTHKLQKQHNLQGPIDDALMGPFLFVRPTGTPLNERVGEWVEAELNHAIRHWRQQMRGDVRIKNDTEVSEEDIARFNLILWGDVSSNAVISKVQSGLPLSWNATELTIGDQAFEADNHAPILVYPNPLNPERYVVLNSSFTYREYDYLNNARQTPKLPDWAIIDLRVPPNSRWPGKVVSADFFDEHWQVKPSTRPTK